MKTSDFVASTFGALFVAIDNLNKAITVGEINYVVIVETVLLSTIGALCAFIVNEIAKWAKYQIAKKWKPKNIIKGLITSVLGLSLMAGGGFLVYKAIVSQGWEHIVMLTSEGLSLMGLGAYLLGIEDPRIPRKQI